MAICAVAFVACSEDEEHGVESLVDTVWTCSFEEDDMTLTVSYAFKTNGVVEVEFSDDMDDEIYTVTFEGTYEYRAPNVLIRYMVEDEPYQIAGTVKGDRMILDDEGDTIVLKRR